MDTNEVKSNGKGKKIVAIIATIIAVILVICVIVFASLESKGLKFAKLLTEDQYATQMIKNRKDDFSSDGEKNYNLTLKKDFLSMLDNTFAFLGYDLVLNTNVVNDGENYDSKSSLKLGTLEIQSLDVIKDGNVTILGVPNLFEGYVAVSNDNAEESAEKLGLISSGDIIDEETKEEAEKILKKYGKILIKEVENYITVQNDVEVAINENNVNTKQYTLILGEKEINEIKLALLEKLKDDDETIAFLVKYIKEYMPGLLEEELSEETFKQKIITLYNEAIDTSNTMTGGQKIIELSLYELKGNAIKTDLEFMLNDEIYQVTFATTPDESKDYMVLSLNMLDTKLDFVYSGETTENNYKGAVLIDTGSASMQIIELDIEKVQNSTAKVRRLAELDVLLLDEASDEALESLKNEIAKNLGFSNDDSMEMIYEKGEFELENPDVQVKVLEKSRELYNKINLGMTKDEVIAIMGEPDATFEVDERENHGWYYDDENSIYLISIEVLDGKVYKVCNDIVSDMYDNVQISTELGTQIKDLTELISKLNSDMSKDDVIAVLGDKYVEITKDEAGNTAAKWYDKNENCLIVEFDNEGNVSYINPVSMDI